MQVIRKISRDIIDRRRQTLIGVAMGIVATLLGVTLIGGDTKSDPDRELLYEVSTALDRAQDFWEASVTGFQRAKVVVFEDSTSSGCGRALSSTGPFFCPEDDRIYVDLRFLRAIDGDLGRAIVIGHELGHHLQHLRRELDGRGSVIVETEADCLAGSWIRHERQLGRLEAGDIDEALREIASVGDDRICPGCSPESWSHGSSSQRLAAVQVGLAGIACRF